MPENKIDWEKIVSESNGTRVFIPSSFETQAKEIEEKRAEYKKKVAALAKDQIHINMAVENMFFELRKYLEKNGAKDIWVKDIGYEQAALDDGKLVVNITEPQNRG